MPIHPVLAATGLALVLLLGAAISSPSATSIVIEPETSFEAGGVKGFVRFLGGKDGSGASFVTAGEYVNTAGSDAGKSETIVVQGWTEPKSIFTSRVCSYQYQFTVTTAGGAVRRSDLDSQWWPAKYSSASGNNYLLEVHSFRLDGALVGKIHVDLVVNVTQGLVGRLAAPLTDKTCSTARLAMDEAQLLNGRGNIVVKQGQSDIFQEGDTVTFSVSTGHGYWSATMFNGLGEASCGLRGGGFLGSLTFFSARFASAGQSDMMAHAENDVNYRPSNLVPKAPAKEFAADGCVASVSWEGERVAKDLKFEIPPGAFRSDGKNIWRVVLKNSLTDHAMDQLVVIDQKAKAPEPPKVESTVRDAGGGKKDVTFTLESRRNGATNETITHFVLYVWYGQDGSLPPSGASPNWILVEKEVPAILQGDRYFATYTVSVDPIDVQYRFYAVDAAGRLSGSHLNPEDADVLDTTGFIDHPNTDSGGEVDVDARTETPVGPAPTPPVDSGLAVLILIFVALAAAGVWLYLPASPPLKLGAIVLAGAAALIYAIPRLGWG